MAARHPKFAKEQRYIIKPKKHVGTITNIHTTSYTQTHAWPEGRVLYFRLVHTNEPYWVEALLTPSHEKVGHYGASLPSLCSMHPDNAHMKLQSLQACNRFTALSVSVALLLSLSHTHTPRPFSQQPSSIVFRCSQTHTFCLLITSLDLSITLHSNTVCFSLWLGAIPNEWVG